MKKLLSILGAMGLVATAGASVVACGETSVDNNPSVNYKTFDGWVQDSINNKSSEVIFVGGRTDSDSLSFLGAVESTINTTPSAYKTMISQDQMNKIDDAFSNKYLLTNNNSTIYNASSSAFNDLTAIASNDDLVVGKSGTIKSYLWGDKTPSESAKQVRLHSLLVDDLSTFFKNGLGKDIVSNFINKQVEDTSSWYYESENNNPYDKKHDKAIKDQIKQTSKGLKENLESKSNGPFFLVITNGKLVGISTGFKNYTYYNQEMAGETDIKGKSQYQLSSPQAINDITTLFKKIDKSLIVPFTSWLENNWFPGKTGSNNLFAENKDTIDTTTGWDKSNVNAKVDPSKLGTASSKTSDSKDNSNNDSSNTKSFAIDPTKYIN